MYIKYKKETLMGIFAIPITYFRNKSLKEIAIQLSRGKHSSQGSEGHKIDIQSQENTLLFVGTKGVGKSSLVFRFLEKNDTPKPTLALEYIYARKSGKTVAKDICHIWELGSGSSRLEVASLFSSFSLSTQSGLTLVLMLDLSHLNTLWAEAETFLGKFREIFGSNESVRDRRSDFEHLRIADEHRDKGKIKPFPVPLILVGGKYDLFENQEPNKKRLAVQCLRFLSHVNGASLLFHSSMEPILIKRSRDILNYYSFNSSLNQAAQFDYNKPVYVPFGTDSVASIEGTSQYVTQGIPTSIDKYKHIFTSQFIHQDDGSVNQAKSTADPTLDQNYAEPVVDAMRKQKLEQLDLMRQEMDVKNKYRNHV
uniref:Cytoplasmic dynein 2 light intermediate chain 1 n=1 Tax=Cacopsylla melanoneura TaxID=428564 RepID=A0A8D8TJK7_9HEMI